MTSFSHYKLRLIGSQVHLLGDAYSPLLYTNSPLQHYDFQVTHHLKITITQGICVRLIKRIFYPIHFTSSLRWSYPTETLRTNGTFHPFDQPLPVSPITLQHLLSESGVKMISQSGVHRVFQTVELFEQILLNLPIDDLLPAQIICKYWQQVTASSVAIQRSLFFTHPIRGPVDPIILLKIRSKLTHTTMTVDTQPKTTTPAAIKFAANPLLVKHFPCWMVCWDEDIKVTLLHMDHKTRKRLGRTSHLGPEDIPCKHLEDPRFLRPEASWRRMFITQPPLLRVTVQAWNSVFISVENERGVTMGEVKDCMRWYWGCNKRQKEPIRMLRPRFTMMHDPVSRDKKRRYYRAPRGWKFSNGRLTWDESS